MSSKKSDSKDGPWCWYLPQLRVEDGQLATFSSEPLVGEDAQEENLGHLRRQNSENQNYEEAVI